MDIVNSLDTIFLTHLQLNRLQYNRCNKYVMCTVTYNENRRCIFFLSMGKIFYGGIKCSFIGKMCLNNLFMEIDFTLRMLYRYFNSPLNVVETQGHKLYIRQSVL